MKVILKNGKLIFRSFALPTDWDYDLLGCFFTKGEAWSAGGGDPIYYLYAASSSMSVKYLTSASGTAADVPMEDGDILRLFNGDLFLRYNSGVYEMLTDREIVDVPTTNGQTYDYDTNTSRVQSTPTARSGWVCASVNVNAGDIVAVKGSSGNTPRLVGLQSEQSLFITPGSAVNISAAGYMYFQAPADGTLYYNSMSNVVHEVKILKKQI